MATFPPWQTAAMPQTILQQARRLWTMVKANPAVVVYSGMFLTAASTVSQWYPVMGVGA